MQYISERISYIPATEEPLCADVGVIRADSGIWLYDVGNGSGVLTALSELCAGGVRAVLSHFHPDHTGNLDMLPVSELYVGANTRKYTGFGTVVESDLYICDGAELHIFPLPSTHAKGSLGLEIDGTFAFLGDGTYAAMKNGRPAYNAQLLFEEIRLLRSLSAEYLLLSHQRDFVRRKEQVVDELEEIYAARTAGEPYIFI